MLSPGNEAVLLGIVHGYAEFLPLSSAGHRALADLLFHVHGGPGYEPWLRLATLFATVLAIWPIVVRAVRDAGRALVRPRGFVETAGARDALVALIATVPSVIVAAFLSAPVERWTASPLAIGLGFLGTTAVLSLAHFAGPGARDQPSYGGAVIIGLAQGLAVLPGLSRIGVTIAAALLLGVKPLRAFELSLLVSLPPLVAAVALDGRHALGAPAPTVGVLVAAVVAAGVGGGAARLLRAIVTRGYFGWFAFWVGPLALATMAMGLAWPG